MYEAKPSRIEGSSRQLYKISLLVMDRTTGQKTSKEIEDVNSTLNPLDLSDICRTLYPTTAQGTSSLVHTEHSPG